jgi:single-stranded-DNA-specific exonuclease
MSLTFGSLDGFRAAFGSEIARQLEGRAPSALEIDAEVGLGELDLSVAEELARLAPHGAANREPIFALRSVTARSTRRVGNGHLQLTLDHGGALGEAIGFGLGDQDPGAGAQVDLLATAELDSFRGIRRTRLRVSRLVRAR